jgi:hypothetical protein
VAVLAARDAGRPEEHQVPVGVLAKHAHRRSLLSSELLREEGFDEVVELQAAPLRPAERQALPAPR